MSSPYLSTLHYYVRPRVSTWLGHMVSPYISTSHFFYCVTCRPPVCPCVTFHSSMCVFVVVTRGVNVAVFCSASCRLEVLTRVIFLLGHVSYLRLSMCHVWVCPRGVGELYTCPSLIGPRVCFSFSCMSVSDHHVSETWMLNLSITCRRSYRSISS